MEPVATTMPFGSNDRHTISVLCPLSVCSSSPVSAFQILAVLSNEPVTILSPNGLLKAKMMPNVRIALHDDMLAIIDENARSESSILDDVMNEYQSTDEDSCDETEFGWNWKVADSDSLQEKDTRKDIGECKIIITKVLI